MLRTPPSHGPTRPRQNGPCVAYIDSAGLAALIEGMQKVEAYGGQFALADLQETVRSIFEIARLDQVFRIFPDVDAALAAA